jgi:Kdo2-lipid IVA lauroyltransferase/acyltransferase
MAGGRTTIGADVLSPRRVVVLSGVAGDLRTPADIPPLKTREACVAGAAWCLSVVAGWLPRRVASALGSGLGRVLYHTLAKRRAVALDNLRHAFPGASADRVDAIAREHFRHAGMNALELLTFHRWESRHAPRIRVEGGEALDAFASEGVGVVVFIPHTGNWELLAPLWPSMHPDPMVLAHPLSNRALESLVARRRGVTGLDVRPRQGGLRPLLTGLRNGRAVGLLADQDAGAGGVFVPFFGRLASCEASPAALARHTNCPIVLCAAFRETDGSHRVILEVMPRVVATTPAESDEATLTRLYARLEELIRERPAQWLWMHRRWKTRPPATPDAESSL